MTVDPFTFLLIEICYIISDRAPGEVDLKLIIGLSRGVAIPKIIAAQRSFKRVL